jgi:hypothetical protein
LGPRAGGGIVSEDAAEHEVTFEALSYFEDFSFWEKIAREDAKKGEKNPSGF